jgi:septal ring factor EnvC (AmiA/AmiB activator)
VLSDKSGLTMNKNEAQQQEKQLAQVKAEIEKWRCLHEQEISDTKDAAQEEIGRLEDRKNNLHREYDEIENLKNGWDKKNAELHKLKEDLDKESLS